MTSTDFIKEKISHILAEEGAEFPNSFEVSPEDYYKSICPQFFEAVFRQEYQIKYQDENNNECSLNVNIHYNPDDNFEYFTYKQITHDGTLLFVSEALGCCLDAVLKATTYNNTKTPPHNGCTINYTIGNFVVVNEYGEQFATEDKPWLQESTTVFLPIKYDCKEANND